MFRSFDIKVDIFSAEFLILAIFMPTADRYFFLFNGNAKKDPLVFRWKITAAGKTQINLTRTTFFRTYKQKECPQVWKLISVNTDSLVINFF